MIQFSWVAEVLGGNATLPGLEIGGVSVDGRTIKSGELYFAIKGARFDGHDYIDQAQAQGASAVVVSRPVACSLPQIQVADTRAALLKLAAAWRDRFSLPVVAVTGSCGKTSTRALMQAIFSTCGATLASERSYNNSIGVPLTLLRLRSFHRYAVIEVGANHAGEIAQLIQLVKPTVAMITLAAPAHLAGFGSLEGIAKAKGEIFQGLSDGGVGVINQDDQFASYWRRLVAPKKVLTFGLKKQAEVSATAITFDRALCPHFMLHTPQGEVPIQLNLMGKHNVLNALAAASAACALSIPLQKIQQGLRMAQSEQRRLVGLPGVKHSRIIDDSYNANPASVKAAIELLAENSGTSILVLGDMLELGEGVDQFHQEVGRLAQQAGIRHLFTFGAHSRQAGKAFGENAKHFDSHAALIDELKPLLNYNVTVLVKGSNSMEMGCVANSLLEE